MGFARIFQKILPLIRRRPNFVFQMQDFESYISPKKSICAGLRAMVPPPKTVFCACFHIFQKIFCEIFKKNALDISRVLFQDKLITNDVVPELKFSSTFHGV